jgi:putative alpha-1,2-mannosidase
LVLGLYPVIPGTDVLVIHGPFFSSATMHLANGHTVTLSANDAAAPVVQSLNVNGVATSKSWVRFGDISSGAALDFKVGSDTSAWGSGTDDVPPSFGP